MTLLEAIIKHMDDNNLDSANGINICELIVDNNIDVGDHIDPLIDSFKRHKENQK